MSVDNFPQNAEERAVWGFLVNNGLLRDGLFPVGAEGDACECGVTKFGGKVPRGHSDTPSMCPECGKMKEVLLQIHPPSLPDPLRELFKDERTLVLKYCPECCPSGEEVEVLAFDETFSIDYDEVSDPKIAPFLIEGFETKVVVDSSSENYFEKLDESGVDSLQAELFARRFSDDYHQGKSYFLGYPRYEQQEDNPGEPYIFFCNLEQDSKFSLMWGDAGSAQLWLRNNDGIPHFLLNWQ